MNDGNPGQTQAAFPGRGAARSVAPQIRGPKIFNALSNGSRFSSAPIRAALHPGHEVDVTARILHPPGWARPIGYSNGIAAAGEIVFIAGQVGWDAEQHFSSEDLVPQFEQALKNVLAVLKEAGGAPRDICRMTAYCTDKPAYLAARPQLGRIWRRLMGTHYPAMTLVFVAGLLDAPGKIELEATAVVAAAKNRA